MINFRKKAVAMLLATVFTAGMLSGCGSKSIDGEKTVATVDGTDIPMGVVSLYRQKRIQIVRIKMKRTNQNQEIFLRWIRI